MESLYKILIKREHEVSKVFKPGVKSTEPSTLGTLVMYRGFTKIFTCKTLENKGESTNVPNQDKRILPGFYTCKMTKTKVRVPECTNGQALLLTNPFDPNFEKRRILVHVGNYPQDSEGCILLGESYNVQKGHINNSMKACTDFYKLLENANFTNYSILILETSYSMLLDTLQKEGFAKRIKC